MEYFEKALNLLGLPVSGRFKFFSFMPKGLSLP